MEQAPDDLGSTRRDSRRRAHCSTRSALRRSISIVLWLEQGLEAPPVRLARTSTGSSSATVATGWLPRWPPATRVIEARCGPKPATSLAQGIGRRAGGVAASSHLGDEVLQEEHLACTEEERVRSGRLHLSASLRSVNG